MSSIAESLQLCPRGLRLDCELLWCHILQRERSWLLAHSDYRISDKERAIFGSYFAQRLAGEPLAYLLGCKEFWSMPIEVSNKVLVPRPETELLVELALKLLDKQDKLRVADLGTGSGAIALALAQERPDWWILATDISPEALTVAQSNAVRLKLQINFASGDWCQALPKTSKVQAIIANPPYLADDDPHLPGLSHEPRSALVAGPSGYEQLQRIIGESYQFLSDGGFILLEHGHQQGAKVRQLLIKNRYRQVCGWPDYSGLDRVSAGRR